MRWLFYLLPLGFASGLPLMLTSSTLQAWYANAGLSATSVGMLSLLGQPYLFKFLWAPLFDRYTLPFLGRRKGWLIVIQLLLVIAIMAMASYSPQHQPYTLACVALLVAFLSASQDIVADAYRTDSLSEQEQGVGTAWFIMGYRIALLIAGGAALWLADHWGWKLTYLSMAVILAAVSIVTLILPEPAIEKNPAVNYVETFLLPIRSLFQRNHVLILLLFISLYKLGDSLNSALLPVFLLQHLHFSLTEVGIISKGIGFAAALVGAGLAGLLLLRIRLWTALLLFGLLQALAFLPYLGLAYIGKQTLLLTLAIGGENAAAAMAATTLSVLLMRLCEHQYSAAQFAFLSCLAAITRVFTGPIAGEILRFSHWTGYYWLTILSGLPALILLFYLQKPIDALAKSVE